MKLRDFVQDEMDLVDETMKSPSLSRLEDGGVSESVLGPTTDGGTVQVETSLDLGLNPDLPRKTVSVTTDSEHLGSYATKAGALSFSDLGVQLIFHEGAPSATEGPVIAPVAAYSADTSRGVISVTFDGQMLSTPLHTVLPFQHNGKDWCFAAEAAHEYDQGDPTSFTHWTLFALHALARY